MSKLRIENKYWVTPNHILNNSDLSFKAKWLYWYIQSKPDGWEFSAERISQDSKDWEDSIYAGLKELETAWFLERVKSQDTTWHWQIDYVLHIEACPGFSRPGKALNNIKKEDSKKEDNTSIDVLSKKSHIEEKNSTEKSKSKRSSSIWKVSEPIRAIYVPPTKLMVEERLWQKRWVDKFYEILTLEKMKDPLSLDKICEVYDWTIQFFQEKYDGKIYKDSDTGKMIWAEIIFNEFDKFISHYSEKWDDILCLKARLRKWITNSLKYAV